MPIFRKGVAITSHFWIDDVTSVEPVRYPPGSSLMRNLAVHLWWIWAETPGKRFLRFLQVALQRPYDFLKVRVATQVGRGFHDFTHYADGG